MKSTARHLPSVRDAGDRLRLLFDAALKAYQEQTGMDLSDHPLSAQIRDCNSVDSITTLLQGKARVLSEFQDHRGRGIKSLKRVVPVLSALSSTLGAGVNWSFPPDKALFSAFAILLAATKDVSVNCDVLINLFETIEHFLKRLDTYTESHLTVAMREDIIKIMVELLSTTAFLTSQIKQGRSLKLVKNLSSDDETEAVVQRLGRLTQDEARTTATAEQTITVVYGLIRNMKAFMDDRKPSIYDIRMDDIRDALEKIQEIVSKTNEIRREKLQRDVGKWLSPPNPWKNHNWARELHYKRTSRWFVQGDAFAEWKWASLKSPLWIQGKPGAGKSVLCSAIIEDINDMRKRGLALLACFYCDFREADKKNLRGLLSSLLVQLCRQSDPYTTILSDFHSKCDNGSRHASDDELVGCLKRMLKWPGQPPVYVIIDGLDECTSSSGTPTPRRKVLKVLEELVNLKLLNLRICITSRPESDIKAVLGPLRFRHVSLQDEEGHMQDIVDYVRSVVSTDNKKEGWKVADKELAIEVLPKKGDGTFCWVSCQVDYLLCCPPENIQLALQELPDTLDGTYDRTLKGIDEQKWECVHLLFQFIAAASRPLRVEELADFLAFDFHSGPTPIFRADRRPENLVDAVLSTCPSLLAAIKVENATFIQFSHSSVEEYLTSTRLAEAGGNISRYHITMSRAHTVIAQVCLDILLSLDAKITRASLETFPLIEYAAQRWVDHTRFENMSPNMQDSVKRLFDPSKPHFAVWTWICNHEAPLAQAGLSKSPLGRHMATFISRCGLHDTVNLSAVGQVINAQDFNGTSTPWYQLAGGGLATAIRTLLGSVIWRSKGTNTQGSNSDSIPSQEGSGSGRVEGPQVLLGHCVDASSGENGLWSPLHLASRDGNVEATRALLERGDVEATRALLGRGADVSTQEVKSTPLHLSSLNGHVEVIRMLLKHGADVRAQDKQKSTALHQASEGGHVQVAQVLLEHDASVSALDEEGSTALHVASRCGHVDVIRALLEHGADLASQDGKKRTPLHLASQGGHVEVTRDLLDRGADVSAQDETKLTPLHLASRSIEVTRILLEHRASVGARDEDESTPLHFSSRGGHMEVARVLLEHDASVRARDNNRSTPLHLALRGGHVGVAQLLLEHGAKVNAQDKDKWTPLHLALRFGQEGLTRDLLERGADARARDNFQTTPLHWASEGGLVDIVMVLLARGVDASAEDDFKTTPLHLASQGGHAHVVQLLLEHDVGVNVNVKDRDKFTPLHLASRSGHLRVVQVLLERGADVNAEDMEGWPPVYWAVEGEHEEVAKLLVKHKADSEPAANVEATGGESEPRSTPNRCRIF